MTAVHTESDPAGPATREQMNIVVIGHVDHGKSTVIGRLLADTDSLPEGRLDRVRQECRRNSKPFEYAFLLDALKDEQSQGITIDAARIGSLIMKELVVVEWHLLVFIPISFIFMIIEFCRRIGLTLMGKDFMLLDTKLVEGVE